MASTPRLTFDRLHSQPPGADPTAVPAILAVLHGVTGSSSLYAPFVQQLVDAAAAAAGRPVAALVINLRGHGGSRNLPLPPPDTVEACRDDVLALLRHELGDGQAPAALLGHSMGAKVALSMTARLAEEGAPLPKQVWVIDAGAGRTDPAAAGLLFACLHSVEAVAQPAESLEDFKQALADAGLPEPLQQYMVSRCEPDPGAPGRYRTSYRPATARSFLEDYCTADYGSLVDDPPAGLQLHLLFGSESTILDGCPEEKARYHSAMAAKRAAGGGPSAGAASVQYWEVPGATHFLPWTHAAELAAAIAPALAPALADG